MILISFPEMQNDRYDFSRFLTFLKMQTTKNQAAVSKMTWTWFVFFLIIRVISI